MQKAVRLNILTRNGTTKSSLKWKERQTKEAWKEWHQVANRHKALQGNFKTEERLTRRQDWIAGPLAPNRNSGTERGKYGTLEQFSLQLPTVPESVRAGPRNEGYAVLPEEESKGFEGRTIVGNVVEGDRVVITAGPERLRGLIGHVNHIDLEKEEVKLRNINTVDVRFPTAAQPAPNPANPEPAKYTTSDVPIPMSHIRLVVTIYDDFGRETDAIIRHVHAGPPYVQRALGSNLPSHTRYATGIYDKVNFDEEGRRLEKGAPKELIHETKEILLELDWPPQTFSNTFEHYEGDTQRTNVSRPTWSISFERSPLGYVGTTPTTVDDDPYSRAPYLSTMDVNGSKGLQNVQRAGLDSFIDYTKLHARRERISQGIMNELHSRKKQKPRAEDIELVQRGMIEDARAIWYKDRELTTPKAQAAKVAVVNRILEREEKAEMESEARENEIIELAERVQRSKVNTMGLAFELRHHRRGDRNDELFNAAAFSPDKRLRRATLRAMSISRKAAAREEKEKRKQEEEEKPMRKMRRIVELEAQ